MLSSKLFQITASLILANVIGHFLVGRVLDKLKDKAVDELERKRKDYEARLEAIDSNTNKEKERERIERNICKIDDKVDDIIKDKSKRIFDREMGGYIGLLDRTIYVISWFSPHREFIGAWLVLKAIGTWPNRSSGRIDRFLIGTGLSLMVAIGISWFVIHFKEILDLILIC